jgi:hypothetical protein
MSRPRAINPSRRAVFVWIASSIAFGRTTVGATSVAPKSAQTVAVFDFELIDRQAQDQARSAKP